MKIKIVAIVSSPLQFISTGEYVHQFNIKDYLIVILYYSKKELQQIIEINKIYKLNLKIKLRGYPIIQYCQLFYFSKKIKKCENLILGNYFSDTHLFFNNLILKEKTTVVDDGIIVSSIPDFINSNKKIIKSSLIKKLLYNYFIYPKKIELFSIFQVSKHRSISFIKNNMGVLNSMLALKKTSNKLMIIGQPFVEHKMLNLEHYISIIQNIIKDFKGYKITYFPSRKELPKKLNHLNNLCDIEIINSVNNIEIYLLKNNLIPKKIVGFTSSALITINTIFNSNNNLIDIKSLKIKFENTRLPHKVISKMYNTLYNNGINKYY